MAKRTLSVEYKAGSRKAVQFLQSWSNRPAPAPWDMSDQFASECAAMQQDRRRGFQDTVFLYLQWTLEGTPPSFDTDIWLNDLEDPGASYA